MAVVDAEGHVLQTDGAEEDVVLEADHRLVDGEVLAVLEKHDDVGVDPFGNGGADAELGGGQGNVALGHGRAVGVLDVFEHGLNLDQAGEGDLLGNGARQTGLLLLGQGVIELGLLLLQHLEPLLNGVSGQGQGRGQKNQH